ncbi:MAG TPA: AAA family ATPase, partial [Atopobiaceae bacterium]|nr:AAA family ATPase [Atopobiaceae bacterium]
SMQRPANAQKHEEGDWKRKDISTVAGVYGGNASGKSAFFDAFQFVAKYIVNGFNPNFDIGALFQPFRLDEMTRSGESEFLVDFLGTNDTRYLYELSIMGGKIDYESLRAYNGNRTNRIYERERNGGSYSYKYGRTFSGAKKTYEQMARPETPYISVL